MNGHTREPWNWSKTTGEVDSWSKRPICTIYNNADAKHPFVAKVSEEANARRIVDCVNACVGLNPGAVPAIVEALRGLIALAETMNDASDEGGQLDERYDAARSALALAERE